MRRYFSLVDSIHNNTACFAVDDSSGDLVSPVCFSLLYKALWLPSDHRKKDPSPFHFLDCWAPGDVFTACLPS